MSNSIGSIPGPESVTRRQFPNGMTVLLCENPSSHSVSISGRLSVGALDDLPGKAGLSSFAARCLMRGTSQRTFQQIFENLESMGASVNISSGRHTTDFGARSLPEDFPRVLDILADALRNPTYPLDEVEKVRGEILTALQERAHDTARTAALTFTELLYGPQHPYGRSILGYMETVRAIARDELEEFHCTRFGPQGMIVAIVGALTRQDGLEVWTHNFGTWTPTAGVAHAPVPLPARLSEPRQGRVNIPGATQTDLMLGFVGPSRQESDYLDAVLCNSVLGVFGMMGRLGRVVRDKHGLAYYCSSHLEGGLGPGPWGVSAGMDPASVEHVISSILAEIARIRAKTVPTLELTHNKAFVTGSLPLRLETNAQIARALVDIELYDLGLDYLQQYDRLVNNVTPKSIRKVAEKYLDPQAYAIALAGPE